MSVQFRLAAAEASRSGGDRWEVLNIPAILDGDQAKTIHTMAVEYGSNAEMIPVKAGGSFAPRRFTLKELNRTKANMKERDWQALYMGNPTVEEGAILKRRYWRLWPHKDLPECIFIFQMYDTAFGANESADYSAMTAWGVFENKDREGRPALHMMLLRRWKRRVDAPDLPRIVEAFCHGSKHFRSQPSSDPKRWANMELEVAEIARGPGAKSVQGFHPDKVLIENKASGIWLVKELRRRKNPSIPVHPWNPPKGTRGAMSKYARAQLAALVLEQGAVWYPDCDWCREVIDECARCKFDGSDESDDLPDTVAAAMSYVRQTYKIEIETDIDDEEEAALERKRKAPRRFYG